MQNLWGDEFIVPETKSKVDEILEKIKNPEEIDKDELKKIARSKKIDVKDKLDIIYKYTKQLLREHIKDTLVIETEDELKEYIDKVIQDGVLAYDTETNNSLDAWTGEIIGLCLYSPSNKPAYVPLKHIDYLTRELLPNQVSVEYAKEQLQRIVDNKVYVIMHNGKFDYKFTKTNFSVELPVDWDTMIAVRMIDENEINAKLKYQYKDKVDNLHPVYDIEEVFPIEYAIVDPNIFALYSATDALMTYKLFLYQKGILYQPEQKNVLKLFKNIEMPLVIITGEMELDGIKVDKGYSDRLLEKYTKILEQQDNDLNNEIAKIQSQIDTWRNTKEANDKPRVYPTAKTKAKDIQKSYPYVDENGKRYKLGKSKNEILVEPINVESPQQLAILLYDILKYEPLDPENPRSTDKFALEILDEDKHSTLCKVIRERRVISTLLDDFIIKLPGLINKRTDKIHCNFNQTGKEDKGVVTGRFSSSEPNL